MAPAVDALLMHDKILFGAMGRAINAVEAVPYRKIVGRYPLAMPVQRYVNRAPGRPLDPLVKAYLQLALSPQGQAVIALQQDSDEGYLPLGEGDLQAERNKLDAL